MGDLGLHIVDDGSRDQLPVVFLHAFPLHTGMWRGQREALAGRGRFVGFDVRGLGKSPVRPGGVMLEHYVDDLIAVLDQLEIRSAMLVGLSMGGYVALRAVEREPERVRGLLLCDTQAAADPNAAKLKRAAGIRKLLDEGVGPYADTFLPGVLSKKTQEERPDLVLEARRMILDSTKEGIASALVALATRTDTTEALANVRVPTRVLVGEDDPTTPVAVARTLAGAIPGADLHVLRGAGHMSNLEAEPEFNARLLEHVERVRGA